MQSESCKYIFTKGLLVSKPIVSHKWKITSLLFSKFIFIFVKEISVANKLYLSDFSLTNLLINDVFVPIPLSPTNTILYSSWKLDSTSCFMTSFFLILFSFKIIYYNILFFIKKGIILY